FGAFQQAVAGGFAEMHEILGRAGIGRQDLDLLAGRHLLQQAPGFEDRQRAFHALGIELAHPSASAVRRDEAARSAAFRPDRALPQGPPTLAAMMSAPPTPLSTPTPSPASQAAEAKATGTSNISSMLAPAGDMRLAPQRLSPIAGTIQKSPVASIQGNA